MATRKTKAESSGSEKPRTRRRKKAAEPASRGLSAQQVGSASPPGKVETLQNRIQEDGGAVLGAYRDPVGGNWQVLASLPLELVRPTPFQRDLSEPHVERLRKVIDGMDRFVDPIVAVRAPEGGYWTPNGHHRTAAMRALGGRSIVALVLPDEEVAYKILALNTEKAHNLREKALEVIRMARTLARADPRAEKEFALEFEDPAFLTLGICYEKNGRFAGGAYHPVLKRVEDFLDARLPRALETRAERADRLIELDAAVSEAVQALKERGFQSPYLKAFVVARVNPLRFQRGGAPSFEDVVEKMIAAARRFDASKVRADQLAATGGPPAE